MDPLLLTDLSARGRLAVRGPDRKRFLHGMLSNDIKGLQPGQGCAAVLLTVKAKLVADLLVYDCEGPDGAAELLLELEGSARARTQTDLDHHLIMDDAEIVDRSADLDELGLYAPQGQTALDAALAQALQVAALPAGLAGGGLAHALVGAVRVAVARDLGVPGYHLFAAPEQLAAVRQRLRDGGARPASEDETEILRVEAGVPRYGLDMDEDRLPIEANLDHAVSMTKGCYRGQEPIARLSARGHVNRRLLGLRLLLPEGAPLPPRGTPLQHPSRDGAGTVMTAVRSPRFGAIALGYVHRSLWEPGTVLALPQGEAQVSALPFRAP